MEHNNNLNEQYKNLIKSIKDEGGFVFGKQIVHNMSDGFPLIEKNSVETQKIFIELLWFLKGGTNIDFLLKNDCDLWNQVVYENYHKILSESPKIFGPNNRELDKIEFINKIKQDERFANLWGNVGSYYGELWRSYNTYENYDSNRYKINIIDQLSNVFKNLNSVKKSNKMILYSLDLNDNNKALKSTSNIYIQFLKRKLSTLERKKIFINLNYAEDLLVDDEKELNILFEKFEIPENSLSLICNEISTDMINDFPNILIRYSFLINILSTSLIMIPEFLILNMGEIFIDENQKQKAIEITNNKPFQLLKLKINSENWSKENINNLKSFDLNGFLNSIKYQDFEFMNDN